MVSIFFKIEMALLHGIDYIVRNKQETVRQYEMEVFRIDEFFQSLTTNLFSQFQGERRRKPENVCMCTNSARFQTSLPSWPWPFSFTECLTGGGKRDRNVISWAITEK